jgi:hypothetical protein
MERALMMIKNMWAAYDVEKNLLDPVYEGLHVLGSIDALEAIARIVGKTASNGIEVRCDLAEDGVNLGQPSLGAGMRRMTVSTLHFLPVPPSDDDWQFYVLPAVDMTPVAVRVFCSNWFHDEFVRMVDDIRIGRGYEQLFRPTKGSKPQRSRRKEPRSQMGFLWWGGVST